MTPILHHYPPSLFSEKIRALFGYLAMPWQSVIISPIMPRPLLMPLSGGYRKTPILQIGANVYCDTEIIARTLARLGHNDALYAPGFAAEQTARWADTELFRTGVALNFRPSAMAAQMNALSAADAQAFQKDRAELSAGAPIVSIPPDAAEAHFQGTLSRLEHSLSQPFLFGEQPSIADFSLYHCLWFVAGNEANRALFDGWPGVLAYLERMRAFGHGSATEISADEAFERARDTTPVVPDDAGLDPRLAKNVSLGASVSVQPTDYGRIPVHGTLVSWNANEIVIRRQDDQVGTIIVHFPNHGFEVTAA